VEAKKTVQNVLLVHGAWADGSSWSKVIPLLQAAGLHVTAVQLPLTSLADDAAVVKRAIALEDGPVLLVGHSYGGNVITEAGNDAKVSGLVYVAAFAPDAGESVVTLGKLVPASPVGAEIKPDASGFLKLSPKGVMEDFAQDLPEVEKTTMVATQAPTSIHSLDGPITVPAWKTKPSWYIRTTNDRTIPPELQTIMSKKINAETISLASSHVAMLSHPQEVTAVILRAAGKAP
jgi:pimeloyl-ACP methyl ester carboxylesterase